MTTEQIEIRIYDTFKMIIQELEYRDALNKHLQNELDTRNRALSKLVDKNTALIKDIGHPKHENDKLKEDVDYLHGVYLAVTADR